MEKKEKIKVLVVEDNELYNELLSRALKSASDEMEMSGKYEIELVSFTSAGECIREIEKGIGNREKTIAFVDYYLGEDLNGSDILKNLKKFCRDCKVVILSSARSFSTAVNTLQQGAFEFIFKDGYALTKCSLLLEDIAAGKR